jgi:ribosomal-protein-alanine N-acetyltransferase
MAAAGFTTLWEFSVAPEQQAAFERHYGPDGTWARLFRRAPGYLGSELLHQGAKPLHYVTADRWEGVEAWRAFRSRFADEYERLDREFEALTIHEAPLAVVRTWQDVDRASLVRHANNRKVWRNLKDRFPHPYTGADAENWLALARSDPDKTGFAIEIDGACAGGIGLVPLADVHARCAHIGYWLGEPFWSRGIMTAVVRAVTNHALSERGFLRLEAPVFAWNPASMRVLEKCGYVREGVLRKSVFKDGEVIDSVLYAKVVP